MAVPVAAVTTLSSRLQSIVYLGTFAGLHRVWRESGDARDDQGIHDFLPTFRKLGFHSGRVSIDQPIWQHKGMAGGVRRICEHLRLMLAVMSSRTDASAALWR